MPIFFRLGGLKEQVQQSVNFSALATRTQSRFQNIIINGRLTEPSRSACTRFSLPKAYPMTSSSVAETAAIHNPPSIGDLTACNATTETPIRRLHQVTGWSSSGPCSSRSVYRFELVGRAELKIIHQHLNRKFPAQCLARTGVEQIGYFVQPCLRHQREVCAFGKVLA